MDGTRVAVTGSGRGLGRAYALRLASRGAALAVLDVDAVLAAETARRIRADGGTAEPFAVDVADPDAVEAAFAAVGELDVLINNAGGVFAPWGAMENVAPEQWSRTLAVNLTGTWLCSRAVVPQMKRRGAGKIVNVSSTTFSRGAPVGIAAYIAAKGGVVGLTRALAKELGEFGITVNAIAPGLIPMDRGDPKRAELMRGIVAQVVPDQALAHTGVPEDLCGTVEFLASPASDFMTGQVLNVDGGWALD